MSQLFVFKNGYYFTSKKLSLPHSETPTLFTLNDIPQNSIQGSFWVEGDNNAKDNVHRIISRPIDSYSEKMVECTKSILSANINKEIEFEVIKLKTEESEDTADSNKYKEFITIKGTLNKLINNFILIKSNDQDELININDIYNLRVNDMEINNKVKKTKKSLQIEYTGSEFNVKYLCYGCMWAPKYKIKLDRNLKKLILTLDAVFVLNDNTLIGSIDTVYCVVGYPNMSYTQNDCMMTELDVERTLSHYTNCFKELEKVNEQKRKRSHERCNRYMNLNKGYGGYNQINLDSYGESYSGGANYITTIGGTIPTIGLDYLQNNVNEEEEEQLEKLDNVHMYKIKDVTFSSDSRLNYNLLNTETDYSDIYSVNLNTNLNNSPQIVFHSIKFKNTFEVNLSSGPVMITSPENALIAQDYIKATAENDYSIVQLTRAVDVSCELIHKNTEMHEEGWFSSKMTIMQTEKEIKIVNKKKDKIKVNIKTDMYGKFNHLSDKYSSIKLLDNSGAKYSAFKVEWEFEIPSNTTKVITYILEHI